VGALREDQLRVRRGCLSASGARSTAPTGAWPSPTTTAGRAAAGAGRRVRDRHRGPPRGSQEAACLLGKRSGVRHSPKTLL
jgi:hypothetical protein